MADHDPHPTDAVWTKTHQMPCSLSRLGRAHLAYLVPAQSEFLCRLRPAVCVPAPRSDPRLLTPRRRTRGFLKRTVWRLETNSGHKLYLKGEMRWSNRKRRPSKWL